MPAAGWGSRCFAGPRPTSPARARAFLRLDCWGGNDRLCRFYEDAGFARRERRLVRGAGYEWDVQLFEKPIALERHSV